MHKTLTRRTFLSLCSGIALSVSCSQKIQAGQTLRVQQNKRFLVHKNGKPFFYLGDTAWELFHRANREEAVIYLQDRARTRIYRYSSSCSSRTGWT